MRPLLRIFVLWRGRFFLLAAGAVATVATLIVGVALMFFSGGLLAGVVAGAGAVAALAAAPILLRVLGPARVVLRYAERMLTHDATFRALADLRVWFFRGLTERSAGGLGFRRSGDVLARLVNDIEALDGLYLRILVPLIGAVVLVPVVFFVVFRADFVLAVVVTALFALAAFALPAYAARAAASGGDRLAGADSNLRIAALDAISGVREVRAFEAEGRVVAGMQAREAALFSAQGAQVSAGAWAGAGAFLCVQAAMLAVLIWAHDAAAAALLFLTVAVFEAIGLLPRAGALAGRAVAAARRVLDAAEGPIEFPDPANPVPPPSGSALKFERITFSWRPDRPLVFDGLSLEVPQGSRVALLGPSGVGKSSLAALALKVVAPQAGRVLLGGVDIATLAAADVRARIGWLSQTTHLFEDSIRANLLLAAPGASDAALWAALDDSRIGDMVRALPGGLDAWVGEGGVGFSGGQGRRLALARALLSPAPVLILDEPCAGLDADTERDFYATLNETAQGRTIVLIAHRLTGVERLDRIWRLSGGHAVAAAA